MTVEEFFHKCRNVGDDTIINLWSYNYRFFGNTYFNMPDSYRQLHVSSFYADYKRCEVYVQEYRR